MNITEYPNLLETLQNSDKIVYIFGAGMSMALGAHDLTWSRWIHSGEKYLNTDERNKFNTILSNGSDHLIEAAEFLLPTLKQNGCYDAYMKESFGNLYPSDQELSESVRLIARSGDILTTTNYDQLLEKATGLSSVTYEEPGKILSILNGEETEQIIHLHGLYDPSRGVDNIIADSKQYDAIIVNKGAQFIQELIGTYTVIFVGCGATIEDPNLSGFISFPSNYLNLNIPYYYLCKDGDDVPDMPGNVMPVFYGSDYEEMSQFLKDMALYRMKFRANCSEIIRVNPYTPMEFTSATYGRLHFTNPFNDFIGREEELSRLNAFSEERAQISWWVVIGEGGMGKSRLLLEWMRRLPSQWFGFFVRIGEPEEKYRQFKPFSNTVVVIDYVMGQESSCEHIVRIFIDSFEKTSYKLRLMFLERRLEKGAQNSWLNILLSEMDTVDAIHFQNIVYKERPNQKNLVAPLELNCFSEEDVKKYIENYAESYFAAFPEKTKGLEYNEIVDTIDESLNSHLDKKYYRPLYLSIYTEVCIDNKGELVPENIDDLLELYLNREETRWLNAFDNDKQALYCYLPLLSLASAIDLACINSGDNGYLQDASERLYQKLNDLKKPGKKETSWKELFIIKEKVNKENNGSEVIEQILNSNELKDDIKYGSLLSLGKIVSDPATKESDPDYYFLIYPEYPDIIKEFIVDEYIPEEDLIKFTRLARNQSTLEFGNFLIRAIEDFPEKEAFVLMAITPPDSYSDRFEYYSTLIIIIKKLIGYREAIEQSMISPHDKIDGMALWEMRLWRDIAVVLDDNVSELESSSKNFITYLHNQLPNEYVTDALDEVIKAYNIGLYNSRGLKQLEWFLNSIDEIEYSSDNEESIVKECAEGYYLLTDLRVVFDNSRYIKRDVDKLFVLADKYPKNPEIVLDLSKVCDQYILSIINRDIPGRITKTNRRLWDCFNRIDYENTIGKGHLSIIAGYVAICLANEFNVYHKNDQNRENICEEMDFCSEKVNELYESYESEEKVIMAYASIMLSNLLDHQRPINISDAQCNLFKDWFEQYTEDIEFAEYYSEVLFLRYEYFKNMGLDKKSESVKEMERVAQIADYDIYVEGCPVKEIIEMIKKGFI